MDKKQVQLAIGSLLHDVGKLAYRYNDGRNHSTSGYDFLREQGISDKSILDQIRFHHASMLKNAQLEDDSPAYITYWADNVAAGADRREKSREENEPTTFEKFMPLQSIFNVLNGNHQDFSYRMAEVYDSGEINYPDEREKQYSEEVYGRIIGRIKDGIKSIDLTAEYVNSLLGLLEANLSFVPSSTDKTQLADISLYDHVKVTAAVSGCIYEYLKSEGCCDFKQRLFKNAKTAYEENAFLMLSMDISGIQDFIYTVDTGDALKTLRAKSFYLEIMLEHIIDELLEREGLSRANLIYSGGGHAYILLPNTEETRRTISAFFDELKKWFLDNFGTKLYVAAGYAVCSANSLMDKPAGAYKQIFKEAGRSVSERKSRRYSAEDIIRLNSAAKEQYVRECRICGNTEKLDENDLCPMCASFIKLSRKVLEGKFVSVLSERPEEDYVLLPFDRYMVVGSDEDVRERFGSSGFIRLYSKNKMYTGYNLSTGLWVGDYSKGNSFGELAQCSDGIKRLGVLRADVDNLGKAFAQGFESSNGQQYAGLSRSATFSRKMSMFFKFHIKYILANGRYSLTGKVKFPERHAMIVYSGGDDLFIVGPWNEIIEAAIDINNSLKKYSQGTLTISAGLGMFPEKYPVTAMARQSGELEECSKGIEGKNGITLFDEESAYKWDDFTGKVVGEKFALLKEYLEKTPDKGNSMIYKMMSYIRHSDEKINIARFAYMLGRIEPEDKADESTKELFRRFSMNMYKWIKNGGEDKKQLLTAIYIYVYLNRKEKEDFDGKIN